MNRLALSSIFNFSNVLYLSFKEKKKSPTMLHYKMCINAYIKSPLYRLAKLKSHYVYLAS